MSNNSGGTDDVWAKLVVAVILLAIVSFCYMKVYGWEKDSCQERGGHLEHVVGGRGSVCVGAETKE